jgi:PAS domain S-box-containing protein
MRGRIRNGNWRKAVLLVVATALLAMVIEWGRQTGHDLPIPFLLLFASVVVSGGAAGKLAGAASGVLAAAYVVYSGSIGHGPPSLTGGEFQVLLGVVLFIGTGLLLGRVRDQRDQLQRHARQHETDLQFQIEQLGARFESIFQNSPSAIFLKDLSGRLVLVNRRFSDWYGIAERDAVGKLSHDIFSKEMANTYMAHDREVIETRSVVNQEREIRLDGGGRRSVESMKFPIYDSAGELVGVGTIVTDITERKEIEEALRRSNAQYLLLTDLSPDAVFVHVDGKIVFANPEMARLMGANRAEQLIGMEALSVIHPDHREDIKRWRDDIRDTGQPAEHVEVRYQNLGGAPIEVESAASPTIWDGRDAYLVVARDITERKAMEEQLAQAQKMEALGQLTGGVAHDFNNLLLVIQGNADLLESRAAEHGNLTRPILRAVQRGADLTQRLLAFSRRQTLRSEAVCLAELSSAMHELLVRTLGETVEIEFVAPEGIWLAMADRGQVENALLNLAINARDAMPDGGKLTIELANAHLDDAFVSENPEATVGDYVALAVSDTGSGMSPDVMSHAFEPFFTTKEVGKGSGLGLSMVYGFAKQSRGHVTLHSKEGRGTTVTLYLPRAERASES